MPAPLGRRPKSKFEPDAVPAELRARPQWVCWRYEEREGKLTKAPVGPITGRIIDITNPKTWTSYDVALAAYLNGKGASTGVAYVFSEFDGYCGIDLDGCIGPDGTIAKAVQRIINDLASYTEISPSGLGAQVFIRATKPKWAKYTSIKLEGVADIEISNVKQLFTVTGRHLKGTPSTIESRQRELSALCAAVWPEDAPPAVSSKRLALPQVVLGTDEHRVGDQTVAALKGDEDLYQRGRLLVRIIKDESPPTVVRRESGSPVISPLLAPTLRETLTRSARFCRPKGDELVECHPTQWLVNAIHCRGSWPGVRHLSGYSDAPVLRADGSVWQEPGYDHQTCILYQPNAKFEPVPMNPTRDDAVRSVVALLEVVQDFRFEGECHRAGYVAGLLSPLARACYAGSTPLFLIDANKPGSGKGLLAKTIGQIVSGRELPVSSYCHDAEEMRKQITTIAMAGDPMVLLDNLHGNFGNGPLDRALTTNWWRDRVLSTNLQVELPLLMTWYATGNNVQIVGDTIRRIIHIRLVVLNEHPEHRSDFKHPDLLGWVSISRPNLVRAALTVLSAYIRAGMPRQNLRPMGGFEGWSRLVREAVVWAGLEDPALSTDSLAATSDVETESLEMLVRAWRMYDPHGDGLVVSDLLHSLYDGYTGDLISDDPRGAMRAAIQQITGTPTGRTPDPRRVGNRFKSFRQVVTDGAYLDINPMEKRRNGGVWRLYEVAQSSKSL